MELTRALADHAAATRHDALPEAVRADAARAFLNWAGVAIGGAAEPAPRLAAAMVAEAGCRPQARLIGQGLRSDPASAAFVNCIASSVLAYDDAHLPSVAHPGGPAAAALFALAEARRVSGPDFLNALALGIEVQCRLAEMLTRPPSPFHPALYTNGFSGPVGVAVAAGRMLGLEATRIAWAIGIAASQASGLRATHGTMTAHFRPGHATRAGLVAALLAEKGFDCTADALEAKGGFLDVYAPGADPGIALDGLGTTHVMLANRCKPYPCGIVIHPVIDACLDLRARLPEGALPARIALRVNPAVLMLTGKRAPKTPLESHVSVFHWVACAFLRGRAGLAETLPDCIGDAAILAFQDRVEAAPDPALGKGEAVATAILADGTRHDAHITQARGSLDRPLTDAELDAKFDGLAGTMLAPEGVEALRRACRGLARAEDVGATIGPLLP